MGVFDPFLAFCRRHSRAGKAARCLEAGMFNEQQGRTEAALQCYDDAIRLMPKFARAHFNRGNLLLDQGKAEDALKAFILAVEHKPDSASAYYNMGNALLRLNRHAAAISAYQQAMARKPDLTDAYVAQGAAFEELGQYADAIANYRQALTLNPDYAEVHYNLGRVLAELFQLEEAICCYGEAIKFNPDYAAAHMNLGAALKDLGQVDQGLASTKRALEINPDFALARSNLLFIHNFITEQCPSLLFTEACNFGELVARQARPCTNWENSPDATRRLRVGLVSGDLRAHPVGYFIEGVLAALANKLDCGLYLVAYPSLPCHGEVADRIKADCHEWHSAFGLSDEALVQRIRDDRIDILIDLSGHTGANRLPVFAWKPAPVQVSWLGYFATTGVAAIDYLIADPWTLPESEEECFSETVWRLPETRLCFTPPAVNLQVAPLPALGQKTLVFGCFNNLSKLNDAVLALWARILVALPESRLFLMARQLQQASAQQSILERFAAHGIAAERLIIEGPAPRNEYLAAYHRVDIALDPFPFTGGTTTAEALWMGVPVLTLAGKSFLSRQGVGLLMNAGLPEWVAADPEDYVARAVYHASDLPRLAALRSGLRQQVLASPIFDAPRFATHFEAALRSMWVKWCENTAPSENNIRKGKSD